MSQNMFSSPASREVVCVDNVESLEASTQISLQTAHVHQLAVMQPERGCSRKCMLEGGGGLQGSEETAVHLVDCLLTERLLSITCMKRFVLLKLRGR